VKKIKKIFYRETKKVFSLFINPTFIYLTILGNGTLLLATVTVYHLEKGPNTQMHSFFDALWWGVSTITTVAYGDILPVTFWGRVIGMMLMYTGTVMFVTFTGVLLSTLLKEEVEDEIKPLKNELHREEVQQKKFDDQLLQIVQRLENIEKKLK